MRHSYWGPEFPETRVVEALRSALPDLPVDPGPWGQRMGEFHVARHVDEASLCAETARAISEGEIVGWYQGRSEWGPRALMLAERTYELTQFLVDILKFDKPLVGFDGSVTYHDSCKGLRGLGIKQQPRDLLLNVAGLSLKEMPDCEECCGFGGAFSLRFGEVSTQIVDRKCESIARVAADAVVGGDMGCLINIEGRLRRRGDVETRVLHIAEVLAGGGQ